MVATRAASLLGLNPPEGATTVSWASVPERPLSAEGELRGYVELPGEVDPPDWWVVVEAHQRVPSCRDLGG